MKEVQSTDADLQMEDGRGYYENNNGQDCAVVNPILSGDLDLLEKDTKGEHAEPIVSYRNHEKPDRVNETMKEVQSTDADLQMEDGRGYYKNNNSQDCAMVNSILSGDRDLLEKNTKGEHAEPIVSYRNHEKPDRVNELPSERAHAVTTIRDGVWIFEVKDLVKSVCEDEAAIVDRIDLAMDEISHKRMMSENLNLIRESPSEIELLSSPSKGMDQLSTMIPHEASISGVDGLSSDWKAEGGGGMSLNLSFSPPVRSSSSCRSNCQQNPIDDEDDEARETSFSAAPLSGFIAHLGPAAYSGRLSLQSDSTATSSRSFAFPVLQSEWNSSPVRMRNGNRKRSPRHKRWREGLLCCKF